MTNEQKLQKCAYLLGYTFSVLVNSKSPESIESLTKMLSSNIQTLFYEKEEKNADDSRS